MTVTLKNGKPAMKEAVLALETTIGVPLSDSFKIFVSTQDGVRPERNIFKVDEKNYYDINQFIPVAEIIKERSGLENIPPHAYPFGTDSCGNYLLIDEAKGSAVSFWDHELGHITAQLAPDFQTFLDRLERFDPGKVKLKPGQVKRVWIDPDFLKRIKK
jgi:hypothetical protein